mmetsp:Transcript_44749/g.72868  ORF Transcript_44749/g.72868 Transcript_44749/m.72868 type:complete len:104 (+) Transcript_44749:2607-2918(+)
MEMVCARDTRIVVSIFHDRILTQGEVQELAQLILVKFLQKYDSVLTSLKDVFKELSQSSSTDAALVSTVQSKFADFEPVIASLYPRPSVVPIAQSSSATEAAR